MKDQMPPVAQFSLPTKGQPQAQGSQGNTATPQGMPPVATFNLPNQQGRSQQTSQDTGFMGNLQSGNYGGAAVDAVKNVGNFLFPIAGDIKDDIQGKSTKTALQQTGDAALSILPFIPGLDVIGEGARGADAAVEGGEAIAKSGLLSKIGGNSVLKGAGTGYGMGVASNLSQGQGLGQSLTPNLNNIGGAVLGGVTGGLANKFGAGEGSLAQGATNDITKVLSPTTKINKSIVQQIAPQLAKKGVVSMSREGLLSKYQGNMEHAGEALEKGYQALPQDAKFEVTNLFSTLNKKLSDMSINGVVPNAAKDKAASLVKMMQDLANIGLTHSEDGQQVFSSVDNVRKLRQILDDGIRGGYSFTDLDSAAKAAKLTLSNSIRSEFANQYPQISKLNQDFSFWFKASGVLEDAIERKTGQTGSLRKGIAAGIGAVGGLSQGHPIIGAAVMKTLSDFVDSPAWHTTSALVKSKLASMLGSGDYGGANKLLQGLSKSVPGLIGRVAQPLFTGARGAIPQI